MDKELAKKLFPYWKTFYELNLKYAKIRLQHEKNEAEKDCPKGKKE
ncbi:MAG: hypothetical protein ACOYJ1_05765 [Peptococcales bacterium]|jgi:hypothetical protein